MSKYGGYRYSRYKGRTPKWKIALAVLLVLVILASGGLMLLQRYLVYDGSGRARLEMPWESAPAPQEEMAEPELNIQEPEPVLPSGHKVAAIQDLPLTLAAWENGREYGTLHQLNGLAVTLRSGGQVAFQADGTDYQAVVTAPDTGEALQKLTADAEHAVGLFSCFLDPIASQANLEGMGLKNTGGYIFYDGSNRNWLDPAKPETLTFLSRLLVESAALGFDELVLQDFTYPTVGKLDKIAYTGDRTKSLTTALKTFRAALDEAGYTQVALSVEVTPEALLTGSDSTAGVDVAALTKTADAIYVAAAPEQLPELTAAAERVGAACLVPIFRELPPAEGQPDSFLLLN